MKTFFTFVLIMMVVTIKAQILLDENFDTYQTGVIIGQNGYSHSTSGTDAGSEQAYQVVESDSGKYLKIITRPENYDYTLYKAFAISWPNRNPGNNILEVEYDIFTGPYSTSTAHGGLMIYYDTNGSNFGNMMFIDTKRLTATSWYWGVPIDYYDMGANNTPVNLPENQWVRLKLSYNFATHDIWYSGPGFQTKFSLNYLHWEPDRDIILQFWVNPEQNTESGEFGFDNIIVRAVSQSSLGLDESNSSSSAVNIYPNPATDILSIDTKGRILSAYIYDWAGVRQEMKISNGKIDVKMLPPGSYILGVKTDAGFIKKKFIKID